MPCLSTKRFDGLGWGGGGQNTGNLLTGNPSDIFNEWLKTPILLLRKWERKLRGCFESIKQGLHQGEGIQILRIASCEIQLITGPIGKKLSWEMKLLTAFASLVLLASLQHASCLLPEESCTQVGDSLLRRLNTLRTEFNQVKNFFVSMTPVSFSVLLPTPSARSVIWLRAREMHKAAFSEQKEV